jgi:hypothetical protein
MYIPCTLAYDQSRIQRGEGKQQLPPERKFNLLIL